MQGNYKYLVLRAGNNATSQPLDLKQRLKYFADLVSSEDVMETGEAGAAEQQLPVVVYQLVERLSAYGLVAWYMKLVKRFDLGYSKTSKNTRGKEPAAGGDDDDGDGYDRGGAAGYDGVEDDSNEDAGPNYRKRKRPSKT